MVRENKTLVVDSDLWNKFKRKVNSQGQTMTFVIMGLIKEYMEKQ